MNFTYKGKNVTIAVENGVVAWQYWDNGEFGSTESTSVEGAKKSAMESIDEREHIQINAEVVDGEVVAEDPKQQDQLDSVLDRIRSGKLVMKSFKPVPTQADFDYARRQRGRTADDEFRHILAQRGKTNYGVPPYQKLEQCQEPDGDGGIHRFQRCPCCEARFDAQPTIGDELARRDVELDEALEVARNPYFTHVEVFRSKMPTVNLDRCIGCLDDTLLILTGADWSEWLTKK